MLPEFKLGDRVTYRQGNFIMRGVVINVYYEADAPRYLLMEEPEGKPISKHNQIDTHPAYIMESSHFKGKQTVTSFIYD